MFCLINYQIFSTIPLSLKPFIKIYIKPKEKNLKNLSMTDVGFIGLGKLGLECAEAMAQDDICVHGFDLREKKSNKIIIHKNIKDAIQYNNFIFLAVETPHHEDYDGTKPSSHLDPKDFQYEFVINALLQINEYIREGQTIVLISTVLPGTCRKDFLPIIKKGVNFIYNPYLIAMGTTTWDMLNPEMIIMGSNNVLQSIVYDLKMFYIKILQKKKTRFAPPTLDEAECIKIFYNTFISAKVSLVNMIQDVAELNGNVDCDVVANALSNSSQRIISKLYMKPGMGDGGPCHPRDNIALRFLVNKLDLGYDLFDAIMTSREVQAKRLAEKLVSFKLPIVILGKSFKPKISYTDGSYALLVGYYVNELSNFELGFDENMNDVPCTYLLAHRGCHYDFNFNKDSIVVDPWREFKTNKHLVPLKIIHYGKKLLL